MHLKNTKLNYEKKLETTFPKTRKDEHIDLSRKKKNKDSWPKIHENQKELKRRTICLLQWRFSLTWPDLLGLKETPPGNKYVQTRRISGQ